MQMQMLVMLDQQEPMTMEARATRNEQEQVIKHSLTLTYHSSVGRTIHGHGFQFKALPASAPTPAFAQRQLRGRWE